ncbi:hypothetical protein ANME2D_01854 [Candidatus Methanoperedens nitroreducens]|uniref:Uncharacterized protein n=1 Tax=Candidatus Methanoperedens nitratireducens TaxID=1392998 RepID=A0A062V7Q1_9EURY|nr:hypothetical protein [Candidatus Methanoperedens nitroreducens]KCZ71799.1 hypothetical protein ANME2D_01854 [Candidatus Methanoperedens nitroreducens]MDJ1422227.1 hypothetical protein [Candidatus Methanoperedens sp.]
MEPYAFSVLEYKFARDPETGRRAFLIKYFSPSVPITPKTRDIPIEIQVFEATLNIRTVIGYLLLLVLGPVASGLSLAAGQPVLSLTFFLLGLGIGSILIKTYPGLFKKGKYLKTLTSVIPSSPQR